MSGVVSLRLFLNDWVGSRNTRWLLALVCLLHFGMGALVGLFNGVFITTLRLPSFLVTLATLGLVSGIARRV